MLNETLISGSFWLFSSSGLIFCPDFAGAVSDYSGNPLLSLAKISPGITDYCVNKDGRGGSAPLSVEAGMFVKRESGFFASF